MRISQELTKGTTAMLVLGVISRQELYGYRIIKEIERAVRTNLQPEGGHPLPHPARHGAGWTARLPVGAYRVGKKAKILSYHPEGSEGALPAAGGVEGICLHGGENC